MSQQRTEKVSSEATSDVIPTRKYKLANGQILELTDDEFKEIVSVFEMLLKQSQQVK